MGSVSVYNKLASASTSKRIFISKSSIVWSIIVAYREQNTWNGHFIFVKVSSYWKQTIKSNKSTFEYWYLSQKNLQVFQILFLWATFTKLFKIQNSERFHNNLTSKTTNNAWIFSSERISGLSSRLYVPLSYKYRFFDSSLFSGLSVFVTVTIIGLLHSDLFRSLYCFVLDRLSVIVFALNTGCSPVKRPWISSFNGIKTEIKLSFWIEMPIIFWSIMCAGKKNVVPAIQFFSWCTFFNKIQHTSHMFYGQKQCFHINFSSDTSNSLC